MKIAFWSPLHGTGATANMLAIILAISQESGRSILLTQTHYSMNNLEKPLVGEIEGRRDDDFFNDTGVDALIRYFKAGMLSREVMDSCSIDITDRLCLLAGTKQSSRLAYEDDTLRKIVGYRLNTVTGGSTTEISAETEKYEPVYLDGSFTGNITEYKVRTGTDEILEVVFEKGVCNFRYGDSITVEAILNNGSFVRCTGIVNGSEVAATR